jgi:hypothetical protein
MAVRGDKFFEEEAGQAGGIVADYAVFFEKIVQNDAVAELLELRDIDRNRFGALSVVTLGDSGGNWPAIGDHPIDNTAESVALDGAKMVGEGIAGSFAGLGHQVSDIDSGSF